MNPASTRNLAFLFCLLALSIFVSPKGFGQTIITGPYDNYPGPHHVRVAINFVQSPDKPWTGAYDLEQEANACLATLNNAFNPHNIYFLPYDNGAEGPCGNPSYDLIEAAGTMSIQTIRETLQDPADIRDALHIYIRGSGTSPSGNAFRVPNTYFSAFGSRDNGNELVTRTEVIVQLMGFCLGLFHTFQGFNPDPGNPDGPPSCPEIPGICPEPCTCCGDLVCDTDYHGNSLIQTDSNCTFPGLPDHIVRNFMSFTVPGDCRSEFTPEQVLRMRTFLEKAPELQGVQLQPTSIPGGTIASPSGNIILEPGTTLTIDSPLEMLPGARIVVQQGALLTVRSTISPCEGLWEGIVVNGNNDFPQNETDQGKLVLRGDGRIEHARIGINVQNFAITSGILIGSGGGIVEILGGEIVNCEVGIRFSPYGIGGASNASRVFSPAFLLTDDYRGDLIQPIFMDLNQVNRIKVQLGTFQDLRDCSISPVRAIGIQSFLSGLTVLNTTFEGLAAGIRTEELQINNNPLSVYNSDFLFCGTGVEAFNSSNFVIQGNEFLLGRLPGCPGPAQPPLEPELFAGVLLEGNSAGFTLRNNTFSLAQDSSLAIDPAANLFIGLDCFGTNGGLNNRVRNNTYNNLLYSNRARGINSGPTDGLVYLCNTDNNNLKEPGFDLNSGEGPAFAFVAPGASVYSVQGELVPFGKGTIFPAGNKFSDEHYTFLNQGSGAIDYYFWDNPAAPRENPDAGSGAFGINDEPVSDPNENCITAPPSCDFPCPPDEVAPWKETFYESRLAWKAQQALLPGLTDSQAREETKAAILTHRQAMNRYGNQILTQFGQDTVQVQVDSILHWLQLMETYVTDLRLAKHYFFSGRLSAFDALWPAIPLRYELDTFRQAEYTDLSTFYQDLRAYLPEGEVDALPEPALALLQNLAESCNQAGFLSRMLLRLHDMPLPEMDSQALKNRQNRAPANPKPSANNIKVFPNPASQAVTIQYPALPAAGRLRLFDLHGRLLEAHSLPPGAGQLNLPVSHLAPGLYLLEVAGIPGRTKMLITR